MSLVIDNSVVLAWCLADESDALADAAIRAVVDQGGLAPAIWWYELRNALVVNERRGRLEPADTQATLADLRDLSIVLDRDHDEGVVLELARGLELSVYDAAYLEVARRRQATLATLDERVRGAATRAGVTLFSTPS